MSFETVTERRRGVGEELGICEVVAVRVWGLLRRDVERKDCARRALESIVAGTAMTAV